MAANMQGTIKAAESLDAERQAEFMRKAMRGLGTDERRIIQILASHNNEQRQTIAAKYKQMYGRDMVDDLRSEISGCFEDLVVALLVPSRKYDAVSLNKAIKGAGTDENALIEILCPRNNDEIKQIKEAYKEMYGKDLEEQVASELSGDFKRVMVAQVTGNREDNTQVDEEKVKKDAQDMYDAGEGQIIGTDESVFNKVLCMRSFAHMHAVFVEYKKVASKDILEAIKGEISGDFQDALQSIVKYTYDKAMYYAERFNKAMKGAGTDDDTLIRLIVAHAEMDLQDIKEAYMKMYNRSLQSWIEGDCSGDYKKLLLAVVNGNVSPP